MDRNQWLREFKRRLCRSGLPLHYVRRSLIEVDDHLLEASQNSTSESKLGGLGVSPDELALQFRESYCSAKWYRRMPAMCWFVIPIPVCWMVCLLFYVPCLLLVELSCGSTDQASDWMTGAMLLEWLFYTGKLVTPVIAAFLLVKILEQLPAPRWAWAGCFVILCLGFLITLTEFTLPTATCPPSFTVATNAEIGFTTAVVMWKLVQVFSVFAIAIRETAQSNHCRRAIELG